MGIFRDCCRFIEVVDTVADDTSEQNTFSLMRDLDLFFFGDRAAFLTVALFIVL